MKLTPIVSFIGLMITGLASASGTAPPSRPGHYVRPASCKQFPPSDYQAMFKALDTDHDGYLSDKEFQVHRNEMHGPAWLSLAVSLMTPARTSACQARRE